MKHAATLAAVLVALAGCSSPLASRRAQVMEPGELEVSFVPYGEATAIAAKGTGAAQPVAYPFAEATARFGVVDRMDIQLKVDPTIIPEINVAYEIIGDPTKNDFAVTASLGLKPSVIAVPGASAGLITTPLELIMDVPLGDTSALVVGTRIIPAVTFAGAVTAVAGAVTVAPGGFVALHIDLGPFFVRPEIAVNGVIPLIAGAPGAAVLGPPLGTGNFVLALGVGGTLDFRKKQ